MEDITNSSITVDEILTIVIKVKVIGSNGSIMWLIPYYQYVFCDSAIMPTDCNGCEENVTGKASELHYKVCIDSEEYWVPAHAISIEGYLRTEEQQNFNKFFENKVVDQPRDWKEQYFKCTGIRIGIGEVEHDGYELWLAHLRTRQTEHKIPGEK